MSLNGLARWWRRWRATAAGAGESAKGTVVSDEFDKPFWEEHYRGHAPAGARQPNAQLVAEAGELAPGRALDAGCGEGAEAIWLAGRGWQVTAVDISTAALDRAAGHARALGDGIAGRIDWVQADLTGWTPGGEPFDLVCTHYVHTTEPPEALFRRLAGAVAPGGTLLVVGHHPAAPGTTSPHSPAPGVHVTAEEVAALFDPDRWDIVVAGARTRTVSHGGRTSTLRDTVLRARRRP